MNFDYAKEACPDLPWCQDDPEVLGPCISKFVENHDDFLSAWAEKWFENFQYVHGNHSAAWSKRWGFAVDVDMLSQRGNAMRNRSQTNVTRTNYESLLSLIFGNAPDWDVQASDDSSTQGRRFQKLTEKLLKCYYERLMLEKEIQMFCGILTAYGVAGAKVTWDKNAGRIVEIEEYEEKITPLYESVPTSDPMGIVKGVFAQLNDTGEPREEKRIVPKRDADGSVMTKKIHAGDVRVDMLTPFELRHELTSSGNHKAKWIEHVRIMDFDDYIKEFKDREGRTKYFEEIRPGRLTGQIQKFAIKQFLRMTFVTPMSQGDARRRTSSVLKNDFLKHKVVVIEHYDRPDAEKWPDGRLVITTNGYCTHVITKPNYRTNKIDGWHPFVEATWLMLAPSPMPSSPLNDITAKNKELDTLDSQIDLSTARNFGSAVLIKQQSGIDPDNFYSEPGQIHVVTNTMDAVRYVRDEQPLPPNIGELRQQKKDDINEISGAQDAIRGDRSKGVSSGYAQKVIEEREQRRLTPVRKGVENAVAGIGQKIIACVKANAKDLDGDVYAYLQRSASGEFSTSDVEAFLRTPIDYAVDINVSAGSMQAKSKASNQATLIDLVTKTSAGERLKDAEVLDNFLKEFDAQVLRDGSSVHRDRSMRENEIFSDVGKMGVDATGLNLPIVSWSDDDEIHIASHKRDMAEKFSDIQTNEFELLCREFHIARHEMQAKEKTGTVPAGSTHNFGQTFASVQNSPGTTLQEVQAKKQAQDQAKMQQPPPPQSGAPGAQAQQRGPAQMGAPGAAPMNPNAPSSATQGGQMANNANARIARDGG